MKGTYIFLAPGYEPMEALVPMDVLRRARLDVKFVSLNSERAVKSTQGYSIVADLVWDEFLQEADCSSHEGCMVFPGGLPGADILGDCKPLMELLQDHFAHGGLTAAICAAPSRVLNRNLDLAGRKVTVYADLQGELPDGILQDADVVRDGNLITAKGPGLALPFGFAILEALTDKRVLGVVKKAMMLLP